MNKVLNDNNVIINIISFLIEPPVLINSYYYNTNGNLIFIIDEEYSNNYYRLEITKYINKNYSFCNIINNVLKSNKEYLINGNIYFSKNFILNKWRNTYLFDLDNSINSLSNYNDRFFMYLKNNTKNENILNYNNISEYLKLLKNKIISYDKYIKVSELQFRIRYISIYFNDYMKLNNYDLTKFKVNKIVSFIKYEEQILYHLI